MPRRKNPNTFEVIAELPLSYRELLKQRSARNRRSMRAEAAVILEAVLQDGFAGELKKPVADSVEN